MAKGNGLLGGIANIIANIPPRMKRVSDSAEKEQKENEPYSFENDMVLDEKLGRSFNVWSKFCRGKIEARKKM